MKKTTRPNVDLDQTPELAEDEPTYYVVAPQPPVVRVQRRGGRGHVQLEYALMAAFMEANS